MKMLTEKQESAFREEVMRECIDLLMQNRLSIRTKTSGDMQIRIETEGPEYEHAKSRIMDHLLGRKPIGVEEFI